MSADGLGDDVAVTQAVQHGGVGGKEAAPAHANGREDGDGIAVQDAGGVEGGQQAQRSAHGAQGGHGEGNQFHLLEPEEPFEHPVDFFGQPGEDGNALGRGTVVYARRTGAEGDHDDGRGDDEDARNDLQAQFHTVLAAVQHRIQETHENTVLGSLLFGEVIGRFHHLVQHGAVQFRIGLEAAVLHDAGGNDGAAEGTEQTHQRTGELAVADHGDDDHEAHAEGGAEVGEGNELVFLKVRSEVAVLGQGDDGRVVAEEGHHGAQGCHAGQVVQGLHQGAQEAFQHGDHAELRHQLTQRAGEHGNAHQVEHGVQKKVVGRVHDRLDHIAASHLASQQGENDDEKGQEDQGFHRGAAQFTGFHFDLRF